MNKLLFIVFIFIFALLFLFSLFRFAYFRSVDIKSIIENDVNKIYIFLSNSVRGLNLNQICYIHWHFIDLGTIILFDIPQNPNIIVLNKVNSYTLPTIPS